MNVAIYQGDSYLVGGTVRECARLIDVKEATIHFYLSPAYKKRTAHLEDKAIIAVRVEEDES